MRRRVADGATILAFAAAVLLLAACSQKAVLEKIAPADDRALGSRVISDLQGRPGGDVDLAGLINPQFRDKLATVLPQLRAMTPVGPGRLVDANVTEFHAFTSGRVTRQTFLAYEIDGANDVRTLLRIRIVRVNGVAQIDSLYANPLRAPVEEIGKFTLSGKSPIHYVFLVLAILSPMTILISEIVLFRTKWIRLKWLWAVACLFGYGQVFLDWSTGQVGFTLLNFTMFGAFFVKAGMLAPWRLGIAPPIASMLFLVLRRRLQKPPVNSGEGAAAVATF
jgi:hypothetical protein